MKSNRKLSQNKKTTIGKRMISLLLMLCMCVSITACGSDQDEKSSSTSTTTTSEVSEAAETEASETEAAVTDAGSTEAAGTEASKTEVLETEESGKTEGNNTLVVYFSATGNTKAIAEYIANGISADIYEIVPENPYTEEDLDYGNDNSRSTVEMNDPSVRPGISGSVDNMEQYDTIYIGYPIWWGEAPRIMDTFVESYDFSGKKVIPFCTSASSGIGSSGTNLAEVAGTGDWVDGQRFGEKESQDKVMEWVNGL